MLIADWIHKLSCNKTCRLSIFCYGKITSMVSEIKTINDLSVIIYLQVILYAPKSCLAYTQLIKFIWGHIYTIMFHPFMLHHVTCYWYNCLHYHGCRVTYQLYDSHGNEGRVRILSMSCCLHYVNTTEIFPWRIGCLRFGHFSCIT